MMDTTPTSGAANAETSAAVTAQLQAIADRVVELATTTTSPEAVGSKVEANVLVTRVRHGLTRFANSSIHQHVGEDAIRVSLTLAVDGRTASASSTAIDDADLQALVETTLDSAVLQPVDPHWPGATPASPLTVGSHLDEATTGATPEQRAELVRAFVDAAPELRAAGFADSQTMWAAFASSGGQRGQGATTRATIDGIHQTDGSAGSAHQTSRSISDLDGGAAGARAADRARRSATFVDLEPGTYEVVLGPEAVSTVLTFLAVYGFNAKAHLEGSSFAKLGVQQFDPAITILEDPTDPRAIGLPFDAEGSPRQRFALVEDGVTRSLAHDRRTAIRAGTETTGNAVPGGAGFGAFPANVVMPGGTTPAEQLVEGVERGLLVTQFHYVRILDPKSAVATGLTRNGTFLVEDGRIAGAVGNLRFTQSFVAALAAGQVLGVGDDDRYADGEFGAGMVICPSLRLKAWSFTGGAQG
jgi:predicted Zn-dependent protease